MASVTFGLTAEDRDQLRNTTLVSSVGLPLRFRAPTSANAADPAKLLLLNKHRVNEKALRETQLRALAVLRFGRRYGRKETVKIKQQ